jgi:transposase
MTRHVDTVPLGENDEGRAMARRTFEVVDVVEILRHWYAGDSVSRVAEVLGLDRKTVRKYVGRAQLQGLSPGGPAFSQEEWSSRVRDWFPELLDARARSSVHGEIDRHRERIKELLQTTTPTTIHQRLRDEDGLAVSLTSFRRYLRAEFAEQVAASQVTVLRDDPPPGEEAQVDYGHLGRMPDPATGSPHRVWAFLMTLSFSRLIFVYPVLAMTQVEFLRAHVAAFAFFDGVPARLIPDNLGAGVLKPDLYDPRLNRGYAELSHHYGFLVDPARVAHPRDKPRVERAVPYVRDSFFSGRSFASLADMRAQAEAWCLNVAAQRCCRPLGGATPWAVFAALEAERLQSLPMRPFEPASWSPAKVAPDCHVSVAGALYSVPWKFIGCKLNVRSTESMVFFYSAGELVKSHVRLSRGRRSTDWQDYPPEKAAFFMRTPTWCRHRSAELGEAVAALVGELLSQQALHRLRAAQGVIRLSDTYGPERLNAACTLALSVGDPTYRTVAGILKAGREHLVREEELSLLAPAHLHGPDTLFAHLD